MVVWTSEDSWMYEDVERTVRSAMRSMTNSLTVTKIIINSPATIVFFADGEKEIVKCNWRDDWDPGKAVLIAIIKHTLGKREVDRLLVRAAMADAEDDDRKAKREQRERMNI